LPAGSGEVSRYQEEQSHEERLIGEEEQQERKHQHSFSPVFNIIPIANACIGDGKMVQYHKDDQEDPKVIDIKASWL